MCVFVFEKTIFFLGTVFDFFFVFSASRLHLCKYSRTGQLLLLIGGLNIIKRH